MHPCGVGGAGGRWRPRRPPHLGHRQCGSRGPRPACDAKPQSRACSLAWSWRRAGCGVRRTGGVWTVSGYSLRAPAVHAAATLQRRGLDWGVSQTEGTARAWARVARGPRRAPVERATRRPPAFAIAGSSCGRWTVLHARHPPPGGARRRGSAARPGPAPGTLSSGSGPRSPSHSHPGPPREAAVSCAESPSGARVRRVPQPSAPG